MAEDFRYRYTEVPMSELQTLALAEECRRQEESCLYTAASLHIWQKRARIWKIVFVVTPIILGGIAGSQVIGILGESEGKIIALFCSLLAGFFPAIYAALDMGMQVNEIGQAASEFTNLRDRFRQLAIVKSRDDYDEFSSSFEIMIDRLDSVRKSAPVAPEWCFREAQKKVDAGHYKFEVDAA